MKTLRTDVIIIGCGPAGLLLSQLLHNAGIHSIIVERTSRRRVLSRIRAGILERGTIEAMQEAGCDARLNQQRIDHDGLILGTNGDLFEIPVYAITGHHVSVYGQTEITRDLIEAVEAREQQIFWDCDDVTLDGLTGQVAEIHAQTTGETLEIRGDFIAGCDGFHGPSRQAIPQQHKQEFSREYPFGWLGVLVDQPPVAHNVIYARHDDGFALASMRSHTRSRYYVQTAPQETVADWPMERFWSAFKTRLGSKSNGLLIGEPIERSIAPLRSFVCEKMHYGRLFLAGDAAHIVPPTGAKGLNLAFADVRRLARAFALWKQGNNSGLENYQRDALARVWKVERFSWYLTNLLHSFPDHSAFERRIQHAEIDYIRGSAAAQTMIAENYIGLDFEMS